ncbi:nucleoporin [Cryptosporidium sp. chipmunk genotype I]|uniref:nucleoporin n=1 Tax=Cryptosporidium sp. chipmunk genotype I TaxID=1280935 RepID=UPI00351A9088|nr:nucleoporin [Cryptosporidium sp. chipmunk genotype I]
MLGGGGFGSNQNQQSSGGLFGASTSFGVGIGQQGASQNINTVQQNSTGLFNSSTPLFGGNVSPGLFGSTGSSISGFGNTGQSSVFGQPSNGLFGQSMSTFGGNQQISSTQPSIFGSNSSSTIGPNSGFFNSSPANNSGGFGSFQNSFGTSGGLGGQSSQSNPSNYFGQQNSSGIFGSMPIQTFGNTSSSPFGGTMGTNSNIFGAKKGTNGITFQPVVDRDSDARIMSIVFQKDIDQKKSVEELRWEDYQEKRGPVNSLSINTNFSTNTNNFGNGSFSNSGFGPSSQGNSISNSIFGQPQTPFLSSTTPQNSLFGSNGSSSGLGQTSILGQGLQNSQSNVSNPQFVSNNSGLFGNSNSTSSFSLQSSTSGSSSGLFSTPSLFSSNSNNSAVNNNNNNNNLGGSISSLNSGNLFGQQPSNLGSLDNSFKTSGSLFAGGPATSNSTSLSLFNSNSNTQPQISLSNSSLGMKPLFGNNQALSSSNLGGGSSNANGTNLSTSLFGSTLPSSSSLFNNNSSSGLFGSTQPQNALNNSNSNTSSSSLFGQPPLSQSFGFASINPTNSSWSSLSSGVSNSTISQTSLPGNSQLNNNSVQLQNILGGGQSGKPSTQASSIVFNNGPSALNKLSNSVLPKSIIQNSRYSDSTERGKSLWLWKPLPQFISRSNRYQLDSLSQNSHEGTTNSSELALPALATESARHNTALLTSVRRIEKTIDPQTPAAFLNLLERQQQFFDAVQSPEQNSNSPTNSKTRSLVFTTSHATKFVPLDETFEDAIDDSSSATFSPRVSKIENRPLSVTSKPLINLDSISRFSQDIQIAKSDEFRNSIGRVSIESNNAARTPYLSQHRNSVNSISAASNERQARTSIGLTTPRPITRRPDQLIDNISSDLGKSYVRKQKEFIVESLTPILTKSDYFCIPSIEVLKTFSEERLAVVEDFKIVREGVGEIVWPGITDLRGINLDLVVSIEPLCVSVYGDCDSSIPVGEGLNKKAIVTLKNCKPKRAISSKDPQEIDEFNDHRVKQIKSYTEQMGARFISLDTITWEWKFEVTHFSKYGFLNEDSPLSLYKEFPDDLTKPEDTNFNIHHQENNLLCRSSKQVKFKSHFFVKNQYNFSLYSEIKSIVEKDKSLKKSAYNAICFRSGIYIGSNGFVVVPHRSFCKIKHGVSDYNTSITLFKINKINESVTTGTTNNPGYSRRLISAWLRLYFEIIGNKTSYGCSGVSIESIIKLIFLLWSITKKEVQVFSHLSGFKINSLNFERLKYFEQTFCLIGGILELAIKNSNNQSEGRFETNLRELISWWIKIVMKNIQDIKFSNNNQNSQYLHEERINLLLNNIANGSLFDLVNNTASSSYFIIPRIVSLCLSVGNNKMSVLQIRENLQWWSKIGLISDLTYSSNRLCKTISNIDAFVDDFSYAWQNNVFLSANYSTNPRLSEKLQRMKNIFLIDNTQTLKKLVNSNDINIDPSEAGEKEMFDQIQFQIIKFFFCDEKLRQVELCRFNNSDSIKFSSSFTWLITRVLTFYHYISCNGNELEFSNKLNLMFIQELEILGLWEWAVYVVMHTNMNSSSSLVNCIIMRNIQENPDYLNPEDYLNDVKWKFLVDRLGVPSNWLFEAIIYKLESSGNLLQSLKCTMYLINRLQEKKFEAEDLFFHRSDRISAINNLVISATKKLLDASLLPSILMEISTLTRSVIIGKRTLGRIDNYYFDTYQLDASENLQLIFSVYEGQFNTEIWQTLKSIIIISNQYIKFARRLIESESYYIDQDELKMIFSNLEKFTALRKDTIRYSFERCINNIIDNYCWDVILDTIGIAKH